MPPTISGAPADNILCPLPPAFPKFPDSVPALRVKQRLAIRTFPRREPAMLRHLHRLPAGGAHFPQLIFPRAVRAEINPFSIARPARNRIFPLIRHQGSWRSAHRGNQIHPWRALTRGIERHPQSIWRQPGRPASVQARQLHRGRSVPIAGPNFHASRSIGHEQQSSPVRR